MVSVVGRHPNLEKISFVGHSLGGLIARYAIAVLYQQDLTRKESEENGEHGEEELLSKSPLEEKTRGKIAGLQPINFITSATPHLGARGHRQVILMTCASFLSEWINCNIRGYCVSTILCIS